MSVRNLILAAALVVPVGFAHAADKAADKTADKTTTTTETTTSTKSATAPTGDTTTSTKTSATNTLTVEGTIKKVVAKKKEIYVTAEGKTYEYYFNDKTQLTQAGKPAEFATLKEGMKVRVAANKVGKRLDPQAVEILE